MPKKKTQEQFIEEITNKYGDICDYSKAIYINVKTPVTIICKKHGEFTATPDNLLLNRPKKSPCAKCAIELAGAEKRMSVETFINRAKDEISSELDYSNVSFKTSQDKITITCPMHGEFETRPSTFLYKSSGCPKCVKEKKDDKKRKTQKELNALIRSVHGTTYSFDLSAYKNQHSKIEVTCKIHGNFQVSVSNFLRGRGCKDCGYQKATNKKTLTTSEWIRKAKSVHGERYDYSKTKYVSSKEKVTIICVEHGEFQQRPSNHVSLKRGCAACSGIKKPTLNQNKMLSNEQFISDCKLVHTNSTLDFTKTYYTGSANKVVVTCKKHGDFSVRAGNLKRGGGCRLCAIEDNSASRRVPLDEFIERSSALYDISYDYSGVNFQNLHEKIILGCPIHGEWEVIAANHLYGNSGCPSCRSINSIAKLQEINSISEADFISLCEETHNFKYDYSRTKFTGTLNDIIIICPSHGEFSQSARNHMIGKGCKDCALEIISYKGSSKGADILSRFREIHGGRYKYDLPEKLKYTDKIPITCKNHGVFYQQVRLHLQAKGCPKCSISKGENAISLWLDRHSIDHQVQFPIRHKESGKLLRFDFMLPNKRLLIEYDGQQHFFPVKFGGISEEKAEEVHKLIVERDIIKNELASAEGYKLLRIKYTDDVNEVLAKNLSP